MKDKCLVDRIAIPLGSGIGIIVILVMFVLIPPLLKGISVWAMVAWLVICWKAPVIPFRVGMGVSLAVVAVCRYTVIGLVVVTECVSKLTLRGVLRGLVHLPGRFLRSLLVVVVFGVTGIVLLFGLTILGIAETVRVGREDNLEEIFDPVVNDKKELDENAFWGLEVGTVVIAIYLLSFPSSIGSGWVRVLVQIPGMLLWVWLSAKCRWLSARTVCAITFLTAWVVVRVFRLLGLAAVAIFAVFVFVSCWDLVVDNEKVMEIEAQRAIGRLERILGPFRPKVTSSRCGGVKA